MDKILGVYQSENSVYAGAGVYPLEGGYIYINGRHHSFKVKSDTELTFQSDSICYSRFQILLQQWSSSIHESRRFCQQECLHSWHRTWYHNFTQRSNWNRPLLGDRCGRPESSSLQRSTSRWIVDPDCWIQYS